MARPIGSWAVELEYGGGETTAGNIIVQTKTGPERLTEFNGWTNPQTVKLIVRKHNRLMGFKGLRTVVADWRWKGSNR